MAVLIVSLTVMVVIRNFSAKTGTSNYESFFLPALAAISVIPCQSLQLK
jgi:hypothetical protein